MRLLVLSRKSTLYSTRRLVESATGEGHAVEVLDPLDCWLAWGGGDPAVLLGPVGRRIEGVDVVIPRVGPGATDHGLAVVRQFEAMGVSVLNGASAIARSRDKLRSLQLLSRHAVEILRTVVARGPAEIASAVRMVGGPPVVLKLLRGSHGVGVMLAESEEAVDAILHTVWSLGENLLVQEFVEESRGRDIRALVLGDRVVAAMLRTARRGEFRSNLHRGASAEVVDLPSAYADAAVRATRIVGLDVAGVDLLESRSGPKVIEINPSPGFEGVETATRRDIASLIVGHAVALRLTLPVASRYSARLSRPTGGPG